MTDPITGLPVVGIVGGGQLARMTQQAAIALGVRLRVLSGTADDSAALVTPGTVVGDYRSYEDLLAFAADCDVITFDHEHVPLDHLQHLVTAGVVVRPGPQALPFVQDKIRMRERLGALGAPMPAWTHIGRLPDLLTFGEAQGWPVVVKAASGGYDGKGVWFPGSPEEATELYERIAGEGVCTSSNGCRSTASSRRWWADQRAGRPAPGPWWRRCRPTACAPRCWRPRPASIRGWWPRPRRSRASVAEDLDVVGVMAVELFQVDGHLLVNELAMRPHNSGHWSIEGSRTSQFEQHLRGVLGWPLGETTLAGATTAMANVLGGSGPQAADLADRLPRVLAMDPGAHVHLYGKGVRAGRKIGHVSVVGDDVVETRRRARAAADLLQGDAP